MKNEPCLFGVRLTDGLCFIVAPTTRQQKKLMARPLSGTGLKLTRNKDKESDRSHDCRNVQFELEAPAC